MLLYHFYLILHSHTSTSFSGFYIIATLLRLDTFIIHDILSFQFSLCPSRDSFVIPNLFSIPMLSFPLLCSLFHYYALFSFPMLSLSFPRFLCHSREGGNPAIKNSKHKIKKIKVFYYTHFFIKN